MYGKISPILCPITFFMVEMLYHFTTNCPAAILVVIGSRFVFENRWYRLFSVVYNVKSGMPQEASSLQPGPTAARIYWSQSTGIGRSNSAIFCHPALA